MKLQIRSRIRQLKAAHTTAQLAAMSATACSSVCSDGIWRSAGTVLLYYPLSDEVDVRPLLHQARLLGHKVLLPVVVGNDLELRVYEGEASLRPGAYGIMEPMGELFPPSLYHEIDLAIIPGMAFDGQGHRLGRGKGYYDRLLPRLPQAFRMGICFPFQFLDTIPSEPHDVTMHDVLCQ